MEETHAVDLDAYFRRIAYDGPRNVSVEALSRVAACHASAVPFENLDVVLGRGIALEPAAVELKIVGRGRGGYCFETNQLLMLALGAMGFDVTPISARVRWKMPRSFVPPRTHMFLSVALEGKKWLVDCGVGGVSLTGAMLWEEDQIQRVGNDDRRVLYETSTQTWFHQMEIRGEWLDVSEFTGERMPPIDRAIANWWTSTHPESKFRRNLILARAGLDGVRRSLLNLELTLRRPGAEVRKIPITSQAELEEILTAEFLVPRGDIAADLFEKVRLF